jgi:hypothetical protein
MSTPLERAEEAMNKAQKKLEDAEARFTAGWKRRNGEELTDQYDQEMKVELKEFNDNLQSARQVLLSKEAIYLEEKKAQQQQGIGMGG